MDRDGTRHRVPPVGAGSALIGARRPFSLRERLLLGDLALVLATLLALSIPLGLMFASSERRELALSAERDAVRVASFADGDLSGDPQRVGSEVARFVAAEVRRTGSRIVIVDSEGRSALVSDAPDEPTRSFASRPEFRTALTGRVATGERHSQTLDTDLLYVAVPVSSGGAIHGAVRITYPMSTVSARVRRVWGILAGIGLAVLAAATLLAVRVTRAVTVPLERLQRAAVAAGAGDLSARAPEAGPAEVQELARTFNAMVGRLDDLVGSQRAFVADASHQLRTPLAALRLRLENLQEAHSPEGVDRALGEVGRLSRLVDGLLSLARTDATDPGTERVDVTAVVRERAEIWTDLAAESGIRMDCIPGPTVVAAGRAERLAQVLDNLIENALAVSPRGGAVELSVRRDGAWAEISVRDSGPGLAPEDRDRAFDRFWRGLGSTGEGTGLGLSIVRGLVRADGGEVRLDAAPGGGLVALVRLRAD